MLSKMRQQEVSWVLTGCCAVLWLTGFLSVGHGNLATQWAAPHCPSGQAQNNQHGHNHCAWHCGSLDIQSGGGPGESSTDVHISRVWTLGDIPVQDHALDGQFPPRGPPTVLEIA